MSTLPTLPIATMLMLGLFARVLYLHHAVGAYAMLRRQRRGWLSLELRRHACLVQPNASAQAFPQPQERRVLVLRFAGVPLWRQFRAVGLPLQVDARIDQLGAQEFDHLFQGGFCISGSRG